MKTGELREIEIESLAYGGSGVGRTDGQVIFVPHAAPGDRALVEVTEVKDRFLRGRIREIGRPSRERTEPLCGSYAVCGGCHCQHLSYDRQLHWKQAQVTLWRRDILEGERSCPFQPLSIAPGIPSCRIITAAWRIFLRPSSGYMMSFFHVSTDSGGPIRIDPRDYPIRTAETGIPVTAYGIPVTGIPVTAYIIEG